MGRREGIYHLWICKLSQAHCCAAQYLIKDNSEYCVLLLRLIGVQLMQLPESLSVADPGWSRIRNFHPRSRIKVQKDSRIRIHIKEFKYFNPKNKIDSKLSEIWSKMFIPDLDLNFFPILDPGPRGQKGTGSWIRNTGMSMSQISAFPKYLRQFRTKSSKNSFKKLFPFSWFCLSAYLSSLSLLRLCL